MNGIEAIRESRKDGYWGSPVDGYECLEAERHVDYLLSEVDRLHEMFAKAAKLQAVVDAAREIVADADRPQLARNWATDRLRDALAVYEQGNE